MTQKGRQERVRMRLERWRLLGGNLLTLLSIPLALSPNILDAIGTVGIVKELMEIWPNKVCDITPSL